MKNKPANFSLIVIALLVLTFLMSYTRPAAEEPKQYIIVTAVNDKTDKLEAGVNAKLTEGWHLQGGVAVSGGLLLQSMWK